MSGPAPYSRFPIAGWPGALTDMAKYYVNMNAQANGDHEVHKIGCAWMPKPENRLYLGDFAACRPAVAEARKHYKQTNGCFYCSKECHTG